MSARDTLLDLFLYGGNGTQPEFEEALDARDAEVRAEDAATVRGMKLRTELNYDDRRVNRALERAAVKIEEGEE
ncbi:hypothetical protein DEJ49_33355 [Streptomyces venezuelae]|uniref:Uncharacterized protein n=1 Tax=Streptomyces venezuelae TaxID=54571 RepID=A0A5P2CWI6_STRVZ|nr:hypothetical protein [Streptomyces venezuelae]QES45229.1 hypothetical protein DEJ49_33355 [Streptomyces venezuelae]